MAREQVDYSVLTINTKAGVKRDGTLFDGNWYVDAQWCRFQRGKPRKIGGYTNISPYLNGVSRGLWSYNSNGLTYVYSGWSGGVDQLTVNRNGNTSAVADRTPSGWLTDANAMPTFDTVFDAGSSSGVATISTITNSTTTATVTTSTAHNLYSGMSVTITGATPSAYNGTFVITVTSSTTFTYVMLSDPGGSASGSPVYAIVSSSLIVHVAPNLQYIDSDVEGAAFIGASTATDQLIQIDGVAVSGGLVAVSPYVFYYGSGGEIIWCVPNVPRDITGSGSGQARVTGQKIVKGLPLRGSSQGPAALFWSLNAIVRASFVGSPAIWQFDELSTQSSILASNSVIEYDGRYFWLGVDRFLMFNGVIQDVPNDMNSNYFFDNLNYAAAQKIFAFKVPRFGEIWWCYPRGNATECTHAIILNVRESTWYDTALPAGGRSAALYAQVFRRPMLSGTTLDTATNKFRLWQHETGTDEISGSTLNPIPSWFETDDFTLNVPPGGAPGTLPGIDISILEPDFVYSQPLSVQLGTRSNAMAATVYTDPVQIFVNPDNTEEVCYFRTTTSTRQIRFKFLSNAVGGDYQMGQVLFHARPDYDDRYLK